MKTTKEKTHKEEHDHKDETPTKDEEKTEEKRKKLWVGGPTKGACYMQPSRIG